MSMAPPVPYYPPIPPAPYPYGIPGPHGYYGHGAYAGADLTISDTTEIRTSAGHTYRVTEQIWSKERSNWVPFVASESVDFGDALFVVHHRRYTRDDTEEPFTMVSLKNQLLIDCLRPICTSLENMFQSNPSLEVVRVWPYIEAIKDKITEYQAVASQGGEASERAAVSATVLSSFLELIEKEFAPHREKLHRLLEDGKITFHLLWAAFRTGMRVKQTDEIFKETFGAVVDETIYVFTNATRVFQLRGRTLKWDGSMFVTEAWTHDIQFFDGPAALVNLPVHKLSDSEHIELTDRGRAYVKYAGVHHIHNAGSIHVNAATAGRPIAQESGEVFADGRAMLDTISFHKTRPANPNDMPYVGPYIPPRMPIIDQATGNPAPYRPQDSHLPRAEVPDDELWLLPATLPGFSLVAKLWGMISVRNIRPVSYDDAAWDRLVLDPDVKKLIRSLVDVRAKKHGKHVLKDWVAGKGGGLVMLLHGVAGVGKTLTAEAVAEQLRRPLYVIGAAELGMYANGIEMVLKAALELATKWGAVLLIDEADVYLEKRSTTDTFRNGLVSSFLRMLEYHSGVLFLTTNRVRVFDEAILSRVSVAVKYPELELEQRSKIWWQFLHWVIANSENPQELPKETTSLLNEQSIKELALKPFNGRIIKNVVRTAQALALSADEPLNIDHLRTVVSITEKFMEDTKDIKNDPLTEDDRNEVMSFA